MGDNATTSMRHSCKLATTLHTAGMSVLLINCGMSPQRFREYAPEATTFFGYDEEEEFQISPFESRKEGEAHMLTLDSVRGDLASMQDGIRELIVQCEVGGIILCGWEWASSSWRRRERLQFFLKEIMAVHKCTVVVYAQGTTNPTAGMYDRGGIGRLATLAFAIADIRGVEFAAALAPSVPPLVLTESEWFELQKSAQLEANKTNALEKEKRRYPRIFMQLGRRTSEGQLMAVN
jgi:hypothetical protein